MEHKWKYEEYSQWARQLAHNYSLEDIKKRMYKTEYVGNKRVKSHRKIVEKSSGMNCNASSRASIRMSFVGDYELVNACKNAIEIYEYYPEKCLIIK